MKTTLLDFKEKPITSNFALHIAHSTADNAPRPRGLCREQMIDPRVTKAIGRDVFHSCKPDMRR